MSHFKTDDIARRSRFMANELQIIMDMMIEWLKERKIHAVITETVTTKEEDAVLNRIARSHNEGRAFDMRVHNIPENILNELVNHFSIALADMGALLPNGSRRLCYVHGEGESRHLHVQIDAKYFNRYVIAQFNNELKKGV